jgi:hypothetical protein
MVSAGAHMPRQFVIGIFLVLALFAFELFNFDTTRYALQNLLGEVRFAGLAWAAILAIAFCAIDFAGLARLFTPEKGGEGHKEVWYLTGAWLLGATMNAIMTWWAVSLTLLNHELGNEILSRDQLLTIVPIFVAALVWLTRILFIGAVTVAGGRLLKHNMTARSHNPTVSGQNRGSRQGKQQKPKTSPASENANTIDLGQSLPKQGVQQKRVNRRPPRPRTATAGRPNYVSNRSAATRRRI